MHYTSLHRSTTLTAFPGLLLQQCVIVDPLVWVSIVLTLVGFSLGSDSRCNTSGDRDVRRSSSDRKYSVLLAGTRPLSSTTHLI
jgi:hypothetical protein